VRRLGPTFASLAAVILAGCGTARVLPEDALVIAACPELAPVKLVTPADSWQLHLSDAEQYNTCRCAALRNTKAACRNP
jgi:hypothetical protein